jgi:hypothetical protein
MTSPTSGKYKIRRPLTEPAYRRTQDQPTLNAAIAARCFKGSHCMGTRVLKTDDFTLHIYRLNGINREAMMRLR